MQKIQSFQVNHDRLTEGMYVSRVDGDVVTYDIRMCRPNGGAYLENAGLHTLEHLFATYARSSAWSDKIIYVGPMGCHTGFYLLARDTVSRAEAIALTRAAFAFITGYQGPIPGASRIECGNYLEHDLEQCRQYAQKLCRVLQNWSEEQMIYLP